ncbi:MAG: hypothetical protein HC775_16760 [Hyellaceae cyanobacterium CSU_1_1]|nr:hypothetical protein [Pleurocapsa sp. CRU_1_2]NJR47259.1 hypothetical protein [Hyellaceae cyanobacterium CSU_1_1]
MKIINKQDRGKFAIATESVPESEINLDFNPLINQFELTGDYYLIHWQARAKGYRQWGIYRTCDDSYHSRLKIPMAYGGWSTLQLEDATATTLPSAVLFFKGSLKL